MGRSTRRYPGTQDETSTTSELFALLHSAGSEPPCPLVTMVTSPFDGGLRDIDAPYLPKSARRHPGAMASCGEVDEGYRGGSL